MEIINRVSIPIQKQSIGYILLCLCIEAITAVLKANNDKFWYPTVYTGPSPEQIKREHEQAGEFQAIYMEGGHHVF